MNENSENIYSNNTYIVGKLIKLSCFRRLLIDINLPTLHLYQTLDSLCVNKKNNKFQTPHFLVVVD